MPTSPFWRKPSSASWSSGRRGPTRPLRTAIGLPPLEREDVHALLAPLIGDDRSWRSDLAQLVLDETDGTARDVIAVLDQLAREAPAGQLRPTVAFDAVRRAVPYKGLRVFDGEDSVRFYGRERAVAEVLRALTTTPFVAVVGSSGSGKSSLRPRRLPSYPCVLGWMSWSCCRRARIRCTRSLPPGPEPKVTTRRSLAQPLQADPTALTRTELAGERVLVVVDQLEEMLHAVLRRRQPGNSSCAR